jgi:hypothetical protein
MTEPTTAATTTTAPLIAEDLMLVLLNPDAGVFRGEGSALFHALAGAVLTELAIEGHITIDLERSILHGRPVHAVKSAPPTDPLLRGTWDRLDRTSTDVYSLILEIGPTLRAPFVDRLVERGHLRREKRRFLGLIPTEALVDAGNPRRTELLDAVRPVLVDGAEPDRRTGALVALLSASGQLAALHPDIPWSGAVYTNGARIQRGDWGAAAAGEAVALTAAAILTSTLFATVALPGIRGD